MMYWLIGIITFFALIFYFYFGHYAMTLFYQCMKHDVKISYWELALMKWRGVPINDLLKSAIKLKEKDIDVKIRDLELHMKSGGKVANVVELLLKAKRNKIELTYHQAAIMDLEEIKHRKPVNAVEEKKSDGKEKQEETLAESTNSSPEKPTEDIIPSETIQNEQSSNSNTEIS